MNNYPACDILQPSPGEEKIAQIQFAYQCAEEIKDSCRNLLDFIQNSLDQLKRKRTATSDSLCDVLAKTGSLRKKDCETMMDDIHTVLDEKEQEARDELSTFLRDQKAFALTLKDLILSALDVSSPDLAARSRQLRQDLAGLVLGQERRKEAVVRRLTDFQGAHSRVVAHLESLLQKRDGIRAKDIRVVRQLVDHEWGNISN